jgi:hypothetical protein
MSEKKITMNSMRTFFYDPTVADWNNIARLATPLEKKMILALITSKDSFNVFMGIDDDNDRKYERFRQFLKKTLAESMDQTLMLLDVISETGGITKEQKDVKQKLEQIKKKIPLSFK